jgi:hypothetical protein
MKAMQTLNRNKADIEQGPESALSPGLYKIVLGSTALGLGCMAATLEALRPSAAGFGFKVSGWTFVAFAMGLGAGLLYWKLEAGSRLVGRIANAALLLGGVAGFLYPLRFVPEDKMADIGIGLGLAVCALSLVGFMLWRLKSFFDKDDEAAEARKG